MVSKVTLDALAAETSSTIDLFVCTASFEERCLSIAKSVAARTREAVIVRNKEFIGASHGHHQALLGLFGGRAHDAMVSADSPTGTADVFSNEVIARIGGGSANIFIDITTFTHEQLLILLALLSKAGFTGELRFGYTGAAEYSTNTDEDNVWLSRGVRQVRSILGYPGILAPSKRLHLIVLMGFESERARILIETMEPSRISLGIGDPQQSISQRHFSRNQRFLFRLRTFLEAQKAIETEISTFSFSCIDPHDARDAVLREAAMFSAFNTVLCPMNTKVSTVGVGLAALKDPRLQVVYAAAEEYNEFGYSSPGEYVTTFMVAL